MDIVYPGPHFIRVFKYPECLKQLHLGTRAFDGNDVRVEFGNRFDYVVKLAITHVRMNLRAISYTCRRQPERIHRPAEVLGPVRSAQRQTLAQGWFVDLND